MAKNTENLEMQEDILSQHRLLHSGQGALCIHHAGGIIGGIEDDGPGLLRHHGRKAFCRDLESRFPGVQRHQLRSGEGDDGLVQGEGGHGYDDLIPGI